MIPNLVETVKGYAKHESETLIAVIEKRGSNYDSMTEEQKIESGAAISSVIPNIMALAESYPDLKANQNFMNLSNQLEAVEEDIANSRKYYNGTVKRYNMSVQTIPTNIIAGMFHFEKKPMFEVESQAELPECEGEIRLKIKSFLLAGVFIVLSLFFAAPMNAKAANFTIDKYEVNMKVTKDNTYQIKEHIEVNFKSKSHGIYRDIPLVNDVKREDGSSTRHCGKSGEP